MKTLKPHMGLFLVAAIMATVGLYGMLSPQRVLPSEMAMWEGFSVWPGLLVASFVLMILGLVATFGPAPLQSRLLAWLAPQPANCKREK